MYHVVTIAVIFMIIIFNAHFTNVSIKTIV